MEMINFKTEKKKLLIKKRQESYKYAKICYICEEKFKNRFVKDKKYGKVIDHCHYAREY